MLKSFADISEEFSLHRAQFYKYLQLRHAFQSESRVSSLGSTMHPLMNKVLLTDERKGMISRVYVRLLNATHDASTLTYRRDWERDLGPIDGDTWELCLTSAPLVSVSTSQRLSHLYLLHRVYRTSARLHKWGLRDTPLCPKCSSHNDDLLYMMWKCPSGTGNMFSILYHRYSNSQFFRIQCCAYWVPWRYPHFRQTVTLLYYAYYI